MSDGTKPITIDGPGAGQLTITGHDETRVFICLSGTTSISGLTIKGGSASNYGGGLYNASGSTLSVSDCTISGNSAALDGGGLDDRSGTATLEGCTIGDNSAQYGGGLYNKGRATLHLRLHDQRQFYRGIGGGLGNGGTVTVSDCTISGNSAERDGGGVSVTA